MRAAVYLYGMASIAAGIIDLIWGDFETAHQPIQAFGDHIPGREILAYIAGIWLVVGGAAILSRRTARAGAAALAVIYSIFAVFWLPRFYTASHVFGFRIPVFVGILVGVAQQLILVGAAGIVYTSLTTRDSAWLPRISFLVRCTFGLSSIDFGLAHLVAVRIVAPMILTGIAFVLAGIAMFSGILDVLAARLLALMLLIFSVLVLAPGPLAHPRNHVAWGSNAYNLAAVGAVWIFAESMATRRRKRPDEVRLEMGLIGRHN